MKKLFLSLTLLLMFLVGGFYFLLFSQSGNHFVASYIQSKINKKQNNILFQISDFQLTPKRLDLLVSVDDESYIKVFGDLNIFSKEFNLNYQVDIKDLSKLEDLIPNNLKGSFKSSGIVKGDEKLGVIKGISNIASSSSAYKAEVKNYKFSSLDFVIKDGNIEELLYILNQPIYAIGKVTIDGQIKNADIKNLDGTIKTKLSNVKVINKEFNKAFKLKLKKTISLDGDISSILKGNDIVSTADISSNIANLSVKKSVFNLSDKSFQSDYVLNIQDLGKLQDIVNKNIRGHAIINGNLEKKKGHLYLDGSSKNLGGNVEFILENSKLTTKINDIDVQKLTHMFYYPDFFDSKANLDISYKLDDKKGKLVGIFTKGHFLENNFSSSIKRFINLDITKETYEKISINSSINDLVFSTKLLMNSKNTSIDIYKSIVDINQNIIDSDMKITAKNMPMNVNIQGNIKSPKISINIEDLIKESIKKELFKRFKF